MIEKVLSQFSIAGAYVNAEKFGSGLINDTYLCTFKNGKDIRKYVLQRINTTVFVNPKDVMENVEIVTSHIVNKLRAQGTPDPYAVTPALIHTDESAWFYRDDLGDYWRMFHYIESGLVYDSVIDLKHAFEIGRGLGRFQTLVSDLDPEKLHDTLPGFHHTPRYLKEYDDALAADVKGRAAAVKGEVVLVTRLRPIAPLLTDLMKKGRLPMRVVHNDPKVNNIMIDAGTHEALCMLDLDTVKPGIVHFDFGDCVRSAANRAGENADLDSVRFDLPFFEAVAKGYLGEAGQFLTKKEIEMLPLSVKIITFELGLRFLTDYLRGDIYFKIDYPTHNLHRARVQFKLLDSIEASEDRIFSFISDSHT